MPDAPTTDWKVSERARALHADALIWDSHAGFEPKPSVDLEILELWRAAGVDFLSVNVGYDVVPWQNTVKNIGAFITWLEKHADRFTLVRRVDDILAAKREGKLAIAFDIEGMDSLDGQATWCRSIIGWASARCSSPITSTTSPAAAATTRTAASRHSAAR